AGHHVAGAVAHQDHVHSSTVQQTRHGEVVRRDHRDRNTLLLQFLQCVGGHPLDILYCAAHLLVGWATKLTGVMWAEFPSSLQQLCAHWFLPAEVVAILIAYVSLITGNPCNSNLIDHIHARFPLPELDVSAKRLVYPAPIAAFFHSHQQASLAFCKSTASFYLDYSSTPI